MCERIASILASDLADGEKLLAVAAVITGKSTARELAVACNMKLRTAERHLTGVRKSAEDYANLRIRKSAEDTQDCVEPDTQICVPDTQICVPSPARVEDNNITTNLETTVEFSEVTALNDLQLLSKTLLEAGGDCLANVVTAPNLMVLSTPLGWIKAGCSLEADILPAIRARAVKATPRSIRTWNYFSQAVAEAKAAREQPLPTVHVGTSHFAPRYQPAMTVAEMNAKLEAMGVRQ